MERIDTYLFNNKYTTSRMKASELIKEGKVLVNSKVITKPSYIVEEKDKIEILENISLKYVSRGGLKLEKAINTFNLDFKNKVICDIGSSTGGFSDCSLQNGAMKVYAIDVGTNQLDFRLKNNNKIISLENLNFKDATLDLFNEKIDYYVCDVSFISIRAILNHLKEIENNFNIICLFKPQFEVGKAKLNKEGVVKKENYLVEGLEDFINYCKANNFIIHDLTFSPIIGNKQGNIEFLLYINNEGTFKSFDVKRIVSEAIKALW